jgi:Ferredoxin-like domain in Api92-like protein
MPNWCSNVATINHGDKEKIDAIEAELNKPKDDVALFQMLCPCPDEQKDNWYEWNINHWGTKWEASVYDFERLDDNNIRVNFDTAWGPPISLYDYLFENGYDTTAYYDECGMAFCGKYEFGSNDEYDYSDMDSEQVQDEIPSDIDEMFAISEQMADRESEEQGMQEDDDEEPTYETTDWFSFKIKPVHKGYYEVRTASWPFPHKVEWTGKKWLTDNEITDWRGITEIQHQMIVELEKLKEEFDQLMLEQDSE